MRESACTLPEKRCYSPNYTDQLLQWCKAYCICDGVHGHVTVPVPAVVQHGNVFFIDTGGWADGCYTLLDLNTLVPLQVPSTAGIWSGSADPARHTRRR